MALRELDIHTGLFTPGFLIAMDSRELDFARENGYPLSLITIGIKGFGDFVNTQEPARSKSALMKFGEQVRSITGEGSIVARVGDDEIAVLLPGTVKSKAESIAGQLSETISEDGILIGLRVSEGRIAFGVADSESEVAGFADLLKASKSAMQDISI